MELLRIFQNLISLVAPLLVFTATAYYLIRRRNLDSIFLFVGAGIGFIMSCLFTYLPYYAKSRAMTSENMITYYTIGGIISLLGTVVFAIGLFMLIDRVIRLSSKEDLSKKHYNM